MLDRQQLLDMVARFGVAEPQVRRDHLISHLLAALSQHLPDKVLFFGGTALSRTYLADERLSEDIDLVAKGRRRDVQPAVLHLSDDVVVRIQLLDSVGYPPWPTVRADLEQRYADAPAARLEVPTRAAFAAWKTVAWADRAASRDLFDLWALSRIGAIDAAARLYARFGPTNRPPAPSIFARAPDEEVWQRDLAGQTRLTVSAAEALEVVRRAWGAVR